MSNKQEKKLDIHDIKKIVKEAIDLANLHDIYIDECCRIVVKNCASWEELKAGGMDPHSGALGLNTNCTIIENMNPNCKR